MKKIPSLFVSEEHQLTENVTPGCEWVINGEGHPYIKWDGTACMIKDEKLYKRYDNSRLKNGVRVQKTAPGQDWIHCGDDSERGKYIWWVPISDKDYQHQIAWAYVRGFNLCWEQRYQEGTYELVGPNVQGNPHKFEYNRLLHHNLDAGHPELNEKNPRTYGEIDEFFKDWGYEGIVWHHEDGRMCKITRAKFGYEWR